jgi:hypothetical protein
LFHAPFHISELSYLELMEPQEQQKKESHSLYRAMLERHIGGELGPVEREKLFEHLEYCPECQQILEAEERLLDRLSRIPRLVAPSDLREQILREAERERLELETPLSNDERFADVFRAPGENWESSDQFFEAGKGSARRKRRSILNRYSPALATVFLFAASFTAFLLSDFSSLYPLERAQHETRKGLSAIIALVAGEKPAAQQGTSVKPDASHMNHINSTAHIEIAHKLPKPAERSQPRLAAIVLRPANSPDTYGLDPDDFGKTLRETAEATPAGKMEAIDQFVYDGHRYHCYTLDVGDSWLEKVAQKLEPYRAPVEPDVLSAIGEQQENADFSEKAVEFFAGPGDVFKNAFRGSEIKQVSNSREVRIFVVE